MGVDVQLKIKQHCSYRAELFRPHLAEQESAFTPCPYSSGVKQQHEALFDLVKLPLFTAEIETHQKSFL